MWDDEDRPECVESWARVKTSFPHSRWVGDKAVQRPMFTQARDNSVCAKLEVGWGPAEAVAAPGILALPRILGEVVGQSMNRDRYGGFCCDEDDETNFEASEAGLE